MAKFLTHDWLQALNETVNEHEGFKKTIATAALTLQFEIPDAPEGAEGRYYLAISDGKLVAGPGDATGPDATITNNYETAVALSKGELNTQMAFMTGKLKVAGDFGLALKLESLLKA